MLKGSLYAEALRQWDIDRHKDSIVTATAGVLINITCRTNGDDDIGSKVIHEVHNMAHRLDLYGLTEVEPNIPADFDGADGEWLRAHAHAAWGIFNNVT